MFRACFLAGASASATLGARGVFLCEVFAPLAWPERGFSEQRATDGEQKLAIGISLMAGWIAQSGGRLVWPFWRQILVRSDSETSQQAYKNSNRFVRQSAE